MNLRLIPVPQPQSKTRSPATNERLFFAQGEDENQAIVYPTTQTIDAHYQPSLRPANPPAIQISQIASVAACAHFAPGRSMTLVPISFFGGAACRGPDDYGRSVMANVALPVLPVRP